MDGDNIKILIFLSYAQPFNENQLKFIRKVNEHLVGNNFTGKTLGVTDYSMSVPLVKIREMMNECNGLLSIAFRRSYIANGTCKLGTNLPNQSSYDISGKWITSPYCQIEPAMAFQIDMPILIFREKGVIDEGILDRGAVGYYMPDFDLEQVEEYFNSLEWNVLIREWKEAVLKYYEKKRFEKFEANDIIKHIISCSIHEEKEISSKELYGAFKNSIKRNGWNDYRIFSSNIDPDKKIESRYETIYSSMISDYIQICETIF